MPAPNISPIFPLTPNIGFAIVTVANTAKDGTGTVYNPFTAGAQGARCDFLKAKALGTQTAASVLRIFINNGGASTTPENNALFGEMLLPANTVSEAAVSSEALIYPIGLSLPAGYKILVAGGQATATFTGVAVIGVGGNY